VSEVLVLADADEVSEVLVWPDEVSEVDQVARLDHVAVPWPVPVVGPVPRPEWRDEAPPDTLPRPAEVGKGKQRQRPDAEAIREEDRRELVRLAALREREEAILAEPGSSAGGAGRADRLNLAAHRLSQVEEQTAALNRRLFGPDPGAGRQRAGAADQDPTAGELPATPQLPQMTQLPQLPPLAPLALTPRTPRRPGDRLDGRSTSGPQDLALAGSRSRPSSVNGASLPPLAMAPSSAARSDVPDDPRADRGSAAAGPRSPSTPNSRSRRS
jgi:hypothetical protein